MRAGRRQAQDASGPVASGGRRRAQWSIAVHLLVVGVRFAVGARLRHDGFVGFAIVVPGLGVLRLLSVTVVARTGVFGRTIPIAVGMGWRTRHAGVIRWASVVRRAGVHRRTRAFRGAGVLRRPGLVVRVIRVVIG